MADLDEALRQAPKRAESHAWRGFVHGELRKDYTQAAQELDKAQRLDEQLLDAWIIRLSLLAWQKKHAEAIAHADKAIKFHSEQPLLYAMRGTQRTELNDYPGAVADFNRGLRLEPNRLMRSQLLAVRGATRAGLKQFDQALADLEEAAELDPYNSQAAVNLGAVRQFLGR